MTYISPYEELVAEVVKELNQIFADKLDLEEYVYNSDAAIGTVTGFIAPRDLVPPKQKVLGGFGKYIVNLDVVCEFFEGKSINLGLVTGQYLTRVNNLISHMDGILPTGKKCQNLVPGKFTSTVRQLTSSDHNLVIAIVGSATLEIWMYHESDGNPKTYN